MVCAFLQKVINKALKDNKVLLRFPVLQLQAFCQGAYEHWETPAE